MHAAVTAANRIEEFRYRQVGEEVILYERIDLFTPVQNADGSYRSVRLPAIETFEDFLAVARPLIEAAKRGEGEVHNEAGQGRDILLISVNPVSYTHLDNYWKLCFHQKIKKGRR